MTHKDLIFIDHVLNTTFIIKSRPLSLSISGKCTLVIGKVFIAFSLQSFVYRLVYSFVKIGRTSNQRCIHISPINIVSSQILGHQCRMYRRITRANTWIISSKPDGQATICSNRHQISVTSIYGKQNLDMSMHY